MTQAERETLLNALQIAEAQTNAAVNEAERAVQHAKTAKTEAQAARDTVREAINALLAK